MCLSNTEIQCAFNDVERRNDEIATTVKNLSEIVIGDSQSIDPLAFSLSNERTFPWPEIDASACSDCHALREI